MEFDPALVLAPMAGVTDRQFRLILRRVGGIGLVTMEFISSEALTRGNRRTLQMMHYCEEERPLSIQIYGSDPQRMAEAARIVEGIGADVCDINMGCPSNKVLKGCAGCWLMGDPALAGRIISTVRAAISIPLTVKFRAGVREERLNYVELGRICQDEGVDGVALHPRTAKQMYRDRADWSRIAHLKDALTIPVVGNGDVSTADDALRMFEETGCDAVMIGRASMNNPWIYRQAVDLLAGRTPYSPRRVRTSSRLVCPKFLHPISSGKLLPATNSSDAPPPVEIRQPVVEAPKPSAPTEVQTEPVPPPPQPGPAQPEAPEGFTLRFETDLALTQLVARGEIGLYAITSGSAMRMTINLDKAEFWSASLPKQFHEMDTATVPESVIRALRISTNSSVASTKWGVTLPTVMSVKLKAYMGEFHGGWLVIGADGILRMEP